jgi:membrane-associated phospholipid phosphatase
MRHWLKIPWFTIPILLFFNAGLALLLALPYGREITLLNPWRTEPFVSVFHFVTRLGEVYAFAACFVVLALSGRFRDALLIALTGIVVIFAAGFMKKQFKIDRPISYFEKTEQRGELVLPSDVYLNSGRSSFPSGHTMAAFGLYGLLAFLYARQRPKMGLVFAALAILVAFSRIFLVQHFLVDTLGGAAVGLLLAWIAWRAGEGKRFRRLGFSKKNQLVP